MQTEHFHLHARIEEEHWWFRARRRIMAVLAGQVMPKGDDLAVVDVGCGTGANIAALSRHHTCFGFDISEDAIRLASSKYPQVNFFCSSYPANSLLDQIDVGLILLMDVLEHVEDDSVFLSNLVTSQREGTYLLIMVPADMKLWSHQDLNHGHYRRYHLRELRDLFEGLPVRVHLLSYFNSYLYPVVRILRAFNRLFNRTWGEAGTDLQTSSPLINRILEGIFFHESRFLLEALQKKRRSGLPFGVSLVSILQKEA